MLSKGPRAVKKKFHRTALRTTAAQNHGPSRSEFSTNHGCGNSPPNCIAPSGLALLVIAVGLAASVAWIADAFDGRAREVCALLGRHCWRPRPIRQTHW